MDTVLALYLEFQNVVPFSKNKGDHCTTELLSHTIKLWGSILEQSAQEEPKISKS